MKLQGVLQIDKLGGHDHQIEHCAVDGLKESPGEPVT